MAYNRSEIKANTQYVVFITEKTLEQTPHRWLPNPDDKQSIPNFLADCEIKGWPIFIHERVAYVFASEVAP